MEIWLDALEELMDDRRWFSYILYYQSIRGQVVIMVEGIQYKDFDGWDIDESSARVCIAVTKHQEIGFDILNE